MDKLTNNYEVPGSGRKTKVCLKYDVYDVFNSLAVSLYYEPAPGTEDSDLELFAVITVNLPESADLPFGTQFVDINNYPWVDEWLIENSIAEPSGKIARSGFCVYPAFKFNICAIRE